MSYFYEKYVTALGKRTVVHGGRNTNYVPRVCGKIVLHKNFMSQRVQRRGEQIKMKQDKSKAKEK